MMKFQARTSRASWRGGVAAIVLAMSATAVAAESTEPAAETPSSLAEMGPRELVEDTVGRVLAILADESLDSETRRARIEAIAFDVFDFTTMSKLTLARNWKRFEVEQRKAFVREFKAHLSRTYGSRLDRYRQENVEFLSTREEPRGDVTVMTKVIGGQFDGIEMNYRLRYRKERWRAIDVVIEGVSLVANFRSQFAEVLSKGGADTLIEQLRTKNFDAPGLDDDAAGTADAPTPGKPGA